jgi:hypothetical protein
LYEWYRLHLQEDYVYEEGHKHRPDSDVTKNEIKRIKTGGIKPTSSVYPY